MRGGGLARHAPLGNSPPRADHGPAPGSLRLSREAVSELGLRASGSFSGPLISRDDASAESEPGKMAPPPPTARTATSLRGPGGLATHVSFASPARERETDIAFKPLATRASFTATTSGSDRESGNEPDGLGEEVFGPRSPLLWSPGPPSARSSARISRTRSAAVAALRASLAASGELDPKFDAAWDDAPNSPASVSSAATPAKRRPSLPSAPRGRTMVDSGGPLTALMMACKEGRAEVVRQLLDRGGSLDAEDDRRRTLLHRAAKGGHEAIAQMLLQRGAGVDARNVSGTTPLIMAAKKGHEAVARLLLSRGAAVNTTNDAHKTALHCAAANGHREFVRLLLDRGAALDPRGGENETPLHGAAAAGHADVVRLLLDRGAVIDARTGRKETPLHLAAARDHEYTARLLLDKGAANEPTDASGATPLHAAAASGSAATLRLLVSREASIEACDKAGDSPLHYAAAKGKEETAKLLISFGAPVNMPNHEKLTPLHAAAGNGHEAVAKTLLDFGASIDAPDDAGHTPLHHTATCGHAAVASMLIGRGATRDAMDNMERTPLIVASKAGVTATIRLFLEHTENWERCDVDGYSAMDYALRWKSAGLLQPFIESPRVQLSPKCLYRLCQRFVAAAGFELDVRAVVEKFPARKLNAILVIASLYKETAHEDQRALLDEKLRGLEALALELLDAMEHSFGDRVRRRDETGPWIRALEGCRQRLHSALLSCLQQTQHDAADTWLAKQIAELPWGSANAQEMNRVFANATSLSRPVKEAVDVLEARVAGLSGALDMAVQLGFSTVVAHRFVQRYIRRISECAPPLRLASILPAPCGRLFPGDDGDPACGSMCQAADELEGRGDPEPPDPQQPEPALWWESPTHCFSGWRGKFGMELASCLLFVGLLVAVVCAGGGWLLAPLALQCLGMLAYEAHQCRSEGLGEYFSNGFNALHVAVAALALAAAACAGAAEVLALHGRPWGLFVPVLSLLCIPACLRLVEFGYVSEVLGPMLFVLRRMATDVATVAGLLALLFGSFCLGIWGWARNDAEGAVGLRETAGALYMAALGQGDLAAFEGGAPPVGPALLTLYRILAFALLVNVLTGLFSSTMTTAFDAARAAHAFGRTKRVLRYHRMSEQLVAPLNLLWLPLACCRPLAALAVNLATGLLMLPPLLLLASLLSLGRLAATCCRRRPPHTSLRHEQTVRRAWAHVVQKYRLRPRLQSRLLQSTAEAEGSPLGPTAYCERDEAPDPVHTGTLEAHRCGGHAASARQEDIARLEERVVGELERQAAELSALHLKLDRALEALAKPAQSTARLATAEALRRFLTSSSRSR